MGKEIFSRKFLMGKFTFLVIFFFAVCFLSAKAYCVENVPVQGHNAAKNSISKSLRVGYADVRQIFDSCTQTKEATNSLKKEVDLRQAALAKEEDEIGVLQKELKDKEVILSETEKQKRQQEIQDRIIVLQKSADFAKQDLTQKEKDLTEAILASIKEAIKVVAREENLNLVLEKDSVLYCEDVIDITGKVIEKINNKK